MEKTEFKKLLEVLEQGISVNSIKGRKDRTLLLGACRISDQLGVRHFIHHVYLESQTLHSLLYVAGTEVMLHHEYGFGLHPDQIMHPEVGLRYVPEACDAGFCELLIPRVTAGSLRFMKWDNRGSVLDSKGKRRAYLALCAHDMPLPSL